MTVDPSQRFLLVYGPAFHRTGAGELPNSVGMVHLRPTDHTADHPAGRSARRQPAVDPRRL